MIDWDNEWYHSRMKGEIKRKKEVWLTLDEKDKFLPDSYLNYNEQETDRHVRKGHRA